MLNREGRRAGHLCSRCSGHTVQYCRKWVTACRTCHNPANELHSGLAGSSTVLPQKGGHPWCQSTLGKWWVALTGDYRQTIKRREEGSRPEERKVRPIESVVTWSPGTLPFEPYGVTWNKAQISPSAATPHCRGHRCSHPMETPLWASELCTSGSLRSIPDSELPGARGKYRDYCTS